MTNTILQGDALYRLRDLPDESIDMIITSPPYWGLRDYGVGGQLGSEADYKDFITNLANVFDEVKRVLKKEGTCWVNLGDTFNGSKNGNTNGLAGTVVQKQNVNNMAISKKAQAGIQEKSLVQIPSRFAIEMTDRGWILRNEIIWHKPNAMPQSVKDRFSVDFEKMFFFTKNKQYYFKQQFEPQVDWGLRNRVDRSRNKYRRANLHSETGLSGKLNPEGRNKRSVWSISTVPYTEAHLATYPEKLLWTAIDAGCPEGGSVLDPFFGAGTTGLVADKMGRKWIGIELNPEYIEIAKKRLRQEVLL